MRSPPRCVSSSSSNGKPACTSLPHGPRPSRRSRRTKSGSGSRRSRTRRPHGGLPIGASRRHGRSGPFMRWVKIPTGRFLLARQIRGSGSARVAPGISPRAGSGMLATAHVRASAPFTPGVRPKCETPRDGDDARGIEAPASHHPRLARRGPRRELRLPAGTLGVVDPALLGWCYPGVLGPRCRVGVA